MRRKHLQLGMLCRSEVIGVALQLSLLAPENRKSLVSSGACSAAQAKMQGKAWRLRGMSHASSALIRLASSPWSILILLRAHARDTPVPFSIDLNVVALALGISYKGSI